MEAPYPDCTGYRLQTIVFVKLLPKHAGGISMSRAARSMMVFGVYFIATGAVLVFTPNILLQLLRVPPTTEPWIRVLGVVAGVLGAYYITAARQELIGFFRATVWGRRIFVVGLLLLVLLSWAPPILLGFGLFDAAGALWTRAALRSHVGAA